HDDHISRIENGRRDYRVTPRHMASLTRLQPPPGREADHARLLAELEAAVRAESAEVKASRRARRNKGPGAQSASAPSPADPTVAPTSVTPAPAQPPSAAQPTTSSPAPAQPTPTAPPTIGVQPPTVQPTNVAPAPVQVTAPGQTIAVPGTAAPARARRFGSGTGVQRARRFFRRYGPVLAILAVPLIVGLCVANAALLRMAGQAVENNGALTRLLANLMTAPYAQGEPRARRATVPDEDGPLPASLGERGPMKVPLQPYSWQKRGPCNPNRAQVEIRGGCWVQVGTAPCPSETFEEAGKCYLAVEQTKRPPPQSEIP
ncbi:MAG TPA: hypothetical protein VK420_22490, partial [Longimicrobium sp.]|nr:hypothetical protein [Longimicrobium sp.]